MCFNIAYLVVLTTLSPWLLWRAARTGRYRHDLRAKLTGRTSLTVTTSPTVWFHGVSVGEIHLLATLVEAYSKRHPDHRVVVSSTTDTGLTEARKKFEHVVVWPFDFSWSVAAALTAVKPDLVVLAEGEMWPNFLKDCERRGVPVVVINARLSPRSFKRYLRLAAIARRCLFDRVRCIAAQDADCAERFKALGVLEAKLSITGSLKYDGALKTASAFSNLRQALSIVGPCWVAGSTHAPEEEFVLAAFIELRREFPALTLILVPRHPDRFEDVAKLLDLSGLVITRRSRMSTASESPAVLLLDTIGELSDAWSLATVGYVGGTLDGIRGGQSMIEPAGYGVPTVFGPHVWNFKEPARRLIEAGAAMMVPSAAELTAAVGAILRDDSRRAAMSLAARRLVAEQQGATDRTLDLLDGAMAAVHHRAA